MKERFSTLAAAILVIASTGSLGAAADDGGTLTARDYERAARFMSWNREKYTRNLEIRHRWIGATDELWYGRQLESGRDFVIFDAATGTKRPAFDHQRVAQGLSKLLGSAVEAHALPFGYFEYVEAGKAIRFEANGKLTQCSLECAHCREAVNGSGPVESVSPDGRWAVFVKDHDLWARDTRTGELRPLTADGSRYFAYAAPSESNLSAITDRRAGAAPAPRVIWSPDSTRLITHRLDERQVEDLHLLEYAPAGDEPRPLLHTYRYAMAGDEHVAQTRLAVIEVASARVTWIEHPPVPVQAWTALERQLAWWHGPQAIYFIAPERSEKALHLHEVDPRSGRARKILGETASTYIEATPFLVQRPNVRVLGNGDVIWYSERDGWGHLYLYDGRGRLKRQLTRGHWQVRRIVRVDESSGHLYFTAGGREADRDPYFNHLYRVALGGSTPELLTPEDADHEIAQPAPQFVGTPGPGAADEAAQAFSPSGRYFMDKLSRPEQPTLTVVRAADGSSLRIVEEADIAGLVAGGLIPPEQFQVLAADDATMLYGNLFRPSNFDPRRRYPVIDSVYPGPQAIRSAKRFADAIYGGDQALAELGFIVVNIDGRGTPFRSKAFHDYSYGNLQSAGGLEDHLAAFERLAERYPWMDLERVGIYGYSAGGFMAARAILAHPDFYKVAFAGAGTHDQRGYIVGWGEIYQGPYSPQSYRAQINKRLAGNLEGRLMLAHGLLDDNVHPALSLQLAGALIEANKDFDLLLLPGQNHGSVRAMGYYWRRTWDYFVEHLMGARPPRNYQLEGPWEKGLKAAAAAAARQHAHESQPTGEDTSCNAC